MTPYLVTPTKRLILTASLEVLHGKKHTIYVCELLLYPRQQTKMTGEFDRLINCAHVS